MNIPEANNLLMKVSYKPGWMFRVETSFLAHDPMLIMRAHVQDSDPVNAPNFEKSIDVVSEWFIPGLDVMNQDDFLAFVMRTILAQEIHEVREYLRSDGEAPFHPHTHKGNRAWDENFYDGIKVKTSAVPTS